jgi:hypothetical protein
MVFTPVSLLALVKKSISVLLYDPLTKSALPTIILKGISI